MIYKVQGYECTKTENKTIKIGILKVYENLIEITLVHLIALRLQLFI